ncbi:MAG: dihydroneopterin aldolase [Chloroflexota bacterium]
MDKIIIKDLRAHGVIGVYPHERQAPQDMLINITVYADTSLAAQSDDLSDCVDYAALAKKVKAHAESAARLTVEALANDIARLCLQDQRVKKVCVRVEKPNAVPEAASAGVEVERSRE